jgi:hypothetical protein
MHRNRTVVDHREVVCTIACAVDVALGPEPASVGSGNFGASIPEILALFPEALAR